jgi:polysaccharide pyruvyl transferase WcaK-like protein
MTKGQQDNRPTILLVNHWHDDNKGDCAITGGIVRLLKERWPDAHLRVATLHEAGTSAYPTQLRHLTAAWDVAGEQSFAPTELGSGRPGSPWTALRWLARFAPVGLELSAVRVGRSSSARLHDVGLVVGVGGSNIYDNPDVAQALSLARLAGVLYPVWAAAHCGIPVVLAGHTMGPFTRPAGIRLARRMLRGVRRTSLRETTSIEVARRIGLDDVVVRPDMAFAVACHRTPRVEALLKTLPDGGARPLALVLRTHPHAGPAADERVAAEIAAVARGAIADGVATSLLVVAHTLGPLPVEDDRPAARALFQRLSDQPAVLVEDDLSPEELAAVYGACCAVVTVRLHAAILALSQGTPAYAIAYMTRKTEGVMEAAGLPMDWCSYDDVVAGTIRTRLAQLTTGQVRDALQRRRDGWLGDLRAEVAAWPPAAPTRPAAS